MDNQLVLVDYEIFTYDKNQYLRGYVYSKKSRGLHKVISIADSNLINNIDRLMYQDVTSYITYKLKRDGTVSLTFDYKY